jgi:hypothetical protein
MTATRRKFLRLLAAGSAAAVIAPATTLAATRRRTSPKPLLAPHPVAPPRVEPAPSKPDAMAAEVTKLKGYVAETLKSVRGYSLPPGAEQAFVFEPMPARRRRSRSS